MEKTRIFLSTSLKGGVGKSTVAANVAYQLAKLAQRVLLCDLDVDVRSLDLIMGCESDALFDLGDVVSGRRDYSDARIECFGMKELLFLPAPMNAGELTVELLQSVVDTAVEKDGVQYVILDTPGADNSSLKCALQVADEAIVVASHNPASLRGAQKSAQLCCESNVSPRLVVNSFDYDSVKSSRRSGINDIIDKTSVPLLGVVPYDRQLYFAQERGIPAATSDFISERAFNNIARRIIADTTGERYVPVLKGVKTVKRKKILTR